jgi:hypothetical protein
MKQTTFLKNTLLAVILYLVVKLLIQTSFTLIYIIFYPHINQETYANISIQDAVIITGLTAIQVTLAPVLMWQLFVKQIGVFRSKPAKDTLLFISLTLSLLFFAHFLYIMKMR